MLRVGVMVSGGGTNLQAILDAIDAGKIRNASVEVVISNNPGAYGLERAKKHGIDAICISPKEFADREQFNEALVAKVDEYQLDLVVLAGFLVKIPQQMIDKLLSRTPGQAASAHLKAVSLITDLLICHYAFLNTGTAGKPDCNFIKIGLIGFGKKDRQPEAVYQGKLFFHRIRAVDILVMLHILPVMPGFLNQVPAVGGGINEDIVRLCLHPALNHGL